MKSYDFSKGKRGAVLPIPAGKQRITIRLDRDILDYFLDQVERAGGGNYQTLINNVLRDYIEGKKSAPELEDTLRRVSAKSGSTHARNGRPLRPLPPIVFQHSPDYEIDPAVADPFGFEAHAFAREAETLGDGAASRVARAAADLDAMQAYVVE